jgi:hypothetical protein
VFLDIDGVVNDLPSAMGLVREWPEIRLPIGGVEICIPQHVVLLVRHVSSVAEIRWASTWEELANLLLPDLAGIGPFPYLGPADPDDEGWKARAARPPAETAIREGRPVYWVEDFAGQAPIAEMPTEVRFVDTAADGASVLMPHHLPPELLPEGFQDLGTPVP